MGDWMLYLFLFGAFMSGPGLVAIIAYRGRNDTPYPRQDSRYYDKRVSQQRVTSHMSNDMDRGM